MSKAGRSRLAKLMAIRRRRPPRYFVIWDVADYTPAWDPETPAGSIPWIEWEGRTCIVTCGGKPTDEIPRWDTDDVVITVKYEDIPPAGLQEAPGAPQEAQDEFSAAGPATPAIFPVVNVETVPPAQAEELLRAPPVVVSAPQPGLEEPMLQEEALRRQELRELFGDNLPIEVPANRRGLTRDEQIDRLADGLRSAPLDDNAPDDRPQTRTIYHDTGGSNA